MLISCYFGFLHFSDFAWRATTVVAKGEKADITAKLKKLSPAVLELVPLTLEEIFIYEMEVRGYAVSSEEDK